jgi:hypothetical protein
MGLTVTISPKKVTVPAKSHKDVSVTIKMSNAAAAALPDAATGHVTPLAFDDFGQQYLTVDYIGGRLLLKPTVTKSGVMTLRVPWSVVPRGTSNVWPTLGSYTEDGAFADTKVTLRNGGLKAGIGDFFALGLQDPQEGYDGMDMRAVGVQSLPTEVCDGTPDPADRCLIAAINNWTRFSNAAENWWALYVDVDGGGADYEIDIFDGGLVFGGFEGIPVVTVWTLPGFGLVDAWYAVAPVNSSTILAPFLASDLGLAATGDTDFEYYAESYELWDDDGDPGAPVFHYDVALTGNHPDAGSQLAAFDIVDNPISNGHFVSVAPNAVVKVDTWVDRSTWEPDYGQEGWLIVTLEDLSGPRQADILTVGPVPPWEL